MKKIAVYLASLLIVALPFLVQPNLVGAATPTLVGNGPNLIANPSADEANGTLPQDWQQDKWATNTPTFTYKTDGHTGRSLYVDMKNRQSGDAKWTFKAVTLNANTKYTFKDFYKASVGTELVVQYQDTAGNYTYEWLLTAPASTAWKEIGAAFTAPANVKQATVFHVIAKNGWLQTDDSYLGLTDAPVTPPVLPPTPPTPPVVPPTPPIPPTPPAPPVTPPAVGGGIVPNASVETVDLANAAKPADWAANSWGTNTPTFSYANTGQQGNRSLRVEVTSRTSGDAKWSFTPQKVTAGKTYQFSDYYQSNVVTEVDAAVTLTNGTTQYFYMGTVQPSTGWQKFSSQFTMPANADTVTVFHVLYSVGWLNTDSFSFAPMDSVGFNRALVSLTFDDAWRSIYTNGLPAMQKYGFVSTQYLLSGITNDPEYMTLAMMKAFRDSGHEIAAHTIDHEDLTLLTQAQAIAELNQSKQDLQQWLGVNVNNFASPYGSTNATVIDLIKQYYDSHRGVQPGFNAKGLFDPYNIQVQNVVNTTTTDQIAAWVAKAQADKTWLVLVYHEVSNNPIGGDQYYLTPAQLDAQMAAVKASGVTVQTIAQALAEITPQL